MAAQWSRSNRGISGKTPKRNVVLLMATVDCLTVRVRVVVCVCVESSVRSGKLVRYLLLLSAGASRRQWMHVIAPLGTHPPSLPRARPSTAPERGLEYVALRQENTS